MVMHRPNWGISTLKCRLLVLASFCLGPDTAVLHYQVLSHKGGGWLFKNPNAITYKYFIGCNQHLELHQEIFGKPL